MCLHLSISVPSDAVVELHRTLPAIALARPELDSQVVAAIANGGACFCLGVTCACDLFRKGTSASERLRKRAKRHHWSDAKLERALKGVVDDWSGLHPDVREPLAAIASSAGKVSVFVYWAGRGGRSDMRETQEVEAHDFLTDSSLVAENRLVVVSSSRSV
jgi:hypothetical protein